MLNSPDRASIPRRVAHRTLAAVAIAILLVLLPGCIVRSLHPWFGKEHFTFDPDLIGGWISPDDDLAMTFLKRKDDSGRETYVVQYSSFAEKFGTGHGVFAANLARIAGNSYVTFHPAQEDTGPLLDRLLLLQTHSVARVEVAQNSLTVRLLDYEKIKGAARRGELPGLRMEWLDDELLIVSTSEELRNFLIARGRDADLFGPPMQLVRKK